ncbi:phage holin [Staphylococcus simulans]|uniref:phage holin n=1 Tax=Staphylococcus simulans TaxID=1286 RepID=UPI000D02724F|nr:phage holin [Staphylococcus simulans]AVO02296.1 PTS mannose transporter subunit IID [Staphylococcus simulans]AVO05242.1 PTS mannose transporter subunit IID [Staphylococcus simulans]AWG18845.1 PTS mannose transporter subunit IID [Staphylococcus simulans]AWI01792.1 PTS mannose transporter subunit IID [Staphylococcus simulans]PTI97323.1 PTS mannose transporter subunit IID [Staphylococcus simulans]
MKDKIKQFVGLIGGFLGALYLALQASGISAEWINPRTVDAWINVINTGLPLALVAYGVWKNTFIVKKSARDQEDYLKEKGLK